MKIVKSVKELDLKMSKSTTPTKKIENIEESKSELKYKTD